MNQLDKTTRRTEPTDPDTQWWQSLGPEEQAELLQRYAPERLINDRLKELPVVCRL